MVGEGAGFCFSAVTLTCLARERDFVPTVKLADWPGALDIFSRRLPTVKLGGLTR